VRCTLCWTRRKASETEAESPPGWYVALSAAPLSELAGDSSVFSWGVRVDEWDSSLTVGVAFADAQIVAPGYGVCDKAFGAFVSAYGAPMAVHNRATVRRSGWKSESMPSISADAQWLFRLTADLTANTVAVAVEHVLKGTTGQTDPLRRMADSSWVLSVPDLSRRHLHVAAAALLKLTLTP
jgi:hypothetical protein